MGITIQEPEYDMDAYFFTSGSRDAADQWLNEVRATRDERDAMAHLVVAWQAVNAGDEHLLVRGLEEVVRITKEARKGNQSGYVPRSTRLYPIVRPVKKLLDNLPLYTWEERLGEIMGALEKAIGILSK
jgi:hypothetical protein